jgi:transposase
MDDLHEWLGIPETLWNQFRHLAQDPQRPFRKAKRKGGRPRIPNRRAFGAILWILRSGGTWKHLPKHFCSARTAQRRLKEWDRARWLHVIFRGYLSCCVPEERLRWRAVIAAEQNRRIRWWAFQFQTVIWSYFPPWRDGKRIF